MWTNESLHARFRRQLIRQRAIANMQNVEYLRQLRYCNDLAKRDQRLFGQIWEEHGTNVYKLIAGACGETWDEEDEQKTAFALKKIDAINKGLKGNTSDDDLDATREKGARERQHQLQGIAQASVHLVEKGRSSESGPEKSEEARPEEEGEGRARGGEGGGARS